ncbi:MAG: hypothetical protein AB7U75_12200 [Hyphomicrobiaceae bacterium]
MPVFAGTCHGIVDMKDAAPPDRVPSFMFGLATDHPVVFRN